MNDGLYFDVNTSLPPIHPQDGSVTFDPSEIAEVFSMVFWKNQCEQELT